MTISSWTQVRHAYRGVSASGLTISPTRVTWTLLRGHRKREPSWYWYAAKRTTVTLMRRHLECSAALATSSVTMSAPSSTRCSRPQADKAVRTSPRAVSALSAAHGRVSEYPGCPVERGVAVTAIRTSDEQREVPADVYEEAYAEKLDGAFRSRVGFLDRLSAYVQRPGFELVAAEEGAGWSATSSASASRLRGPGGAASGARSRPASRS
jgi:hypothetical protein